MPEQQDFSVTEPADGTVGGQASNRAFALVEHAAYLALGVLLALTAVVALYSAGESLWDAILNRGAAESIIATIDHILFVLMLLEILHTVRVSVRSGVLNGEPFLIVGLIASIRRVLVITLGSSQAVQPGHWSPDAQEQFQASMMELGVLAVMIIVMVAAIWLLRRADSRGVSA